MQTMTIERNSERIGWIDTARGLTMLCVILGHMDVGKLRYIIHSFHMPIFFVISGLFLRVQAPKRLVEKKAKSLLYPYVFTSACVVSIKLIKNMAKQILHMKTETSSLEVLFDGIKAMILGSNKRGDYPLFESDASIGIIWFFVAMFFAILIANGLLRYKHGQIYIFLLGIVSMISAHWFWLPFSFQPALVGAIYIGGVMRFATES